jgi:hypothetical protein
MTNETFVYNKGKRTSTFIYDKGKKSSGFTFNKGKKASNFSVNTAAGFPSWNQTVDDTSQDFYRTWDWVFMSKGYETISENWEDFG